MIRCKICKKLFRQITWMHLKYIHNITVEDYKKKYPNVKYLQCKSLRRLRGERTKGKRYAKGYIFTEEQRKNCSIAKQGNPGFQGPHTEEAKEKISKANKGKQYALEWLQSKIGREKNRIRMLKMLADGTLIPGTGVRCKMYPIMNYVLGETVKVRGRLELRFAELLNRLGIRWIIPKYKTYILNGKEHYYFCDFYLKDYRYYIEVKSRYYYNLHKKEVLAKKRMMIKRGKRKGFKYKIMFEKNINILERRIRKCLKNN